MRTVFFIVIPVLLSLLAITACNNVGCTENRNSIPLAGFYSYTTHAPITVDSLAIGGVGAPNDSLLLRPSAKGTQVYLPLRSSADVTKFYIRYKQKALDYPELYDTLTFTYTAVPYFASEDCGAMYHYRISRLDHTTHLIDSVGLTDSLVTNLERETIRIFFRTAQTDEKE